MTYTGNYDPTQGSSTPRLRSEGSRPATGFISSSPYKPGQLVPGLGHPGLGIPSFSQATQFFQGQMAPQFEQINLQNAQNTNKIAQLRAQMIQANQFAQQNMGLGDRKYNLDIAGIDLARQANESDQDYTNRIINLLEVNYNRQNDLLNREQDLTSQNYTGAYGAQDKLLALANELLGLQTADRDTTFYADKRHQIGQSAAAGAFGASGNILDAQDIRNHYENDLANIQLNFKGTKAQVEEAKRNLTNQYQQAILGFEGKRGDLTYALNRERESLWHEQEANAREMEMLDLKAQEAGLARDQLVTQLTQGLKNMGLENTVNINNLMAALTSGETQKQILAQQVLQAATQVAGPPPSPPNQAYQPGGGAYVRKGKAF